jgi:outer membrane protein assembly factor BamB
MPASFFDRLPRRPVVALSGHWHTDRVVEVDGTCHVNTGPATFGGLDHCPPHYRVVDVATSGASVRTVPEWHAHMAGVEMIDDLAVVALGCRLVGIDPASGTERWSVPLTARVKATPRACGDVVVACTVTGEVVCVDARDGRERWRTTLHPDPLHLWAYVRPFVHDGLVFAGDVGAFAALDVTTGRPRWTRSDLGHRENLTTLAHPCVVDGMLVGTFAGQSPAMFGLDPVTGATRWPEGGVHGIYEAGADLASELPRVVVGGVTPDPAGADVYVVRLGSRVERVRAADGTVVWSSPFHGWFNPAAPVVVGDTVVTSTSTGQVWCYDRTTGETRWSTVVSGDGPLAMGAYRADGASILAGVTPLGDRLLQPTGDGRIVVLDAATGEVTGAVDAGAPVVAPLARAGDLVVAIGLDGTVRTFGTEMYK